MKKTIISLIFTIAAGFFAGVQAQVTIGSDATPNADAVLDLISNANRGLLLPRVALTATNSSLPLSAHTAGMTVYNTATAGSGNTAVAPGYYYNDGTQWVRIASLPIGVTAGQFLTWDGTQWIPSASTTTEVDGVIGNEVLNATTNGGLVRAGLGTTSSPFTLGLPTTGVTAGQVMTYDPTNGWVAATPGALTEQDGVIGNEVLNATTNGGLVRAGSGTTASPYTLGLPLTGVTSGQIMTFNGTQWVTAAPTATNTLSWNKAAGITSTVNGTAASVTPAAGTIDQLLGYNAAGTPVYQSPGSMNWLLNGNNNGAVKTIGTNDAFDFPIETGGTERMRVTAAGQVLMGTTTVPTGGTNTKLVIDNGTVVGAIQIKDGTQGADKVLTSDANGVATWQTPKGSLILGDVSTTRHVPLTGDGYYYTGMSITIPPGIWSITIRELLSAEGTPGNSFNPTGGYYACFMLSTDASTFTPISTGNKYGIINGLIASRTYGGNPSTIDSGDVCGSGTIYVNYTSASTSTTLYVWFQIVNNGTEASGNAFWLYSKNPSILVFNNLQGGAGPYASIVAVKI